MSKPPLPAAVSMATELSQAVVDQAHRDEIDGWRLEVNRLNSTLDVVQADRDDWHSVCVALGLANRNIAVTLAASEAALERARGLAVRSGAFDTSWPPWEVNPGQEGASGVPGSPWSHFRVWEGPGTLPAPERGLEAERDDGR